MSKKYYIIISIIILVALIGGGGYLIWKSQQNKYINFIDPKLTNNELAQVNGKIIDLESSVKAKEKSLDQNNKDQKADLFKLEMALCAEYRLRGRLLDAKKMAEKAQKLLPDNTSPWNELYVIESARGDYNSAEQAILKIITANPANNQAWRWYFDLASGPLHYTPDKLSALYKEAVAKSNGSADTLALYANYLESTNDLAGAVAQWKLAIEKNPASQTLYQGEIQRIQNKLK